MPSQTSPQAPLPPSSHPDATVGGPAIFTRLAPILGLLVLSGVAWSWPQAAVGWDPFIDPVRTWPLLLNLIFAGAMFVIGTRLPRDEVAQLGRRWPQVVLGTTLQYLSMPLLAWGLAWLLPVPLPIKYGIILTGCVPGAMASNVLTLQARGNASYSVSLTTLATLVSPVLVPFWLSLCFGSLGEQGVDEARLAATTAERFDPWKTAVQLSWTVCLPVLAGFAFAQGWSRLSAWSQRYGEFVAHSAILWIIAVIVAMNRDHLRFDAVLAGGLLALNFGGYAIGYGGGRLLGLDRGMRRALMLEIGMQNAGLGSILATQLFPQDPTVAIPTAVFMFGCMLTGSCLAAVLSRLGGTSGAPTAAS